MEAGKQFGRLTTTGQTRTIRKEYVGNRTYLQHFEECKCQCGKTKWVRRESLTAGNTRSCGCLRSELMRKRMSADPQAPRRYRKQLSLFKD